MLGERLYTLVDQLEHEKAAKVTELLLELDQTEVLHLFESPEALKEKVAEAMEYLRFIQQQQLANNPTGQQANLGVSASNHDDDDDDGDGNSGFTIQTFTNDGSTLEVRGSKVISVEVVNLGMTTIRVQDSWKVQQICDHIKNKYNIDKKRKGLVLKHNGNVLDHSQMVSEYPIQNWQILRFDERP